MTQMSGNKLQTFEISFLHLALSTGVNKQRKRIINIDFISCCYVLHVNTYRHTRQPNFSHWECGSSCIDSDLLTIVALCSLVTTALDARSIDRSNIAPSYSNRKFCSTTDFFSSSILVFWTQPKWTKTTIRKWQIAANQRVFTFLLFLTR